ncbi:16S rRNA (cytosine(967)-C(5))-methyltransferase RsmB [Methylobacillus flagellatus]|uniref:16S rRNA (cytosine(967)-C(5))-methyltransferase RsmB n=1 Tax=Methylobacillus flagellatus TaxID=405 RepID=UPI002853CFD4|nr:16S rRNA (cytosine(967)-C(5))-methyltransferase RsmB [Methylobacillus flagellatus]MDR5170201.1 16S rRNA (cytosine(967)-C(5))-methyltransferase RsmB [Methylobacillus flagellatus]
MQVSQQLAAQAVGQVLDGRNLSIVLETLFQHHRDITPQQRAASQDLAYGTLRFYARLEALLQQLLQHPLSDAFIHHLLLVSLYQLTYDKAGAHTVVNQAVLAAAKTRKTWAKGLVNAVLRNFLRQRDTLEQRLANNEAAQYSYPQWWINKLRQQYPEHWQSMLEAGNQHPPMTLRVNRRHGDAASYLESLQAAGLDARALDEQAIMLEHAVPVGRLPGFNAGRASVQDWGAQFAALELDVADGMRVLDACCAPGGKTGHVLELADVQMTAMDNDAQRLQRVRQNLDRLDLPANLVQGDAGNPEDWWDGVPYDRILADVPCTASGIVRRHVDIKWLRREQDIAAFAEQQRVILQGLWRLLAKGGKLLYATCSVFHEENQQQVSRFLQVQPDARLVPCKHSTLQLNQGQLLPGTEHDGFFYALLQKV